MHLLYDLSSNCYYSCSTYLLYQQYVQTADAYVQFPSALNYKPVRMKDLRYGLSKVNLVSIDRLDLTEKAISHNHILVRCRLVRFCYAKIA